jgi:GLPGLI family protein
MCRSNGGRPLARHAVGPEFDGDTQIVVYPHHLKCLNYLSFLQFPNLMSKKQNIIQLMFIILCACSVHATAQIKGTINYKLTINDGFTSAPRTVNYIVYFTANKSLELPLPKKTESSIIATGDNSLLETRVINSAKSGFIYKNFSAKQLKAGDNVQRSYYLVADTLSNFKWKLTTDQRKILKYTCTRATTVFRGRTYEAWFTDEIPIANGPWKFCGLPGLIISVRDMEGNYQYDLTGINLKGGFDSGTIVIPKTYNGDKEITHRNFIVALRKKIAENDALSRASTRVNKTTSSDMRISLPPKMEKF